MKDEEKKLAYLQMLMEPISRMSTTSAIYKGFAATIVAGIAAISYQDIHILVLALSFLPVLAFAIMDIYHLRLERRFRFLYEEVRSGEHALDFSMQLPSKKIEILAANARVWDCIKSPSIYLFYPMMIAILAIVMVLNMKGTI